MLLGYLITCASVIMTGHLDPATVHTSIYLPVFMPILLPILVLFLPVLDMCLAIVRRLSILWGWAALIAFGSILILFFPAAQVLGAMTSTAVVLAALTLFPYIRHRWDEVHDEEEHRG